MTAMRRIDADLEAYVRQFNEIMAPQGKRRNLKYDSMFDFLLREGRVYDATPYTPEEEEMILEAFRTIGRTPQIKQCYYNSQSLAISDALGYAEGYVVTGKVPVPLEHGWNTLPSGKAVDVTIRPMGGPDTCSPRKLLDRARKNQQGNAYLGVEFPSDLIRKTWARTHQARMLLGEPEVLEQIFERGYPKTWRSPSLGVRRGIEEKWLREEEGQDPDAVTTPFEGEVPPWAHPDYRGENPMGGKLTYIVAYVGDRPTGGGRKNEGVSMPALPLIDVGASPSGVSFGSDYMFHPIAAVPVRKEDEKDSGPVVAYLVDLIKSTGLFGKIVSMEKFPDADVVTLFGGRWFPVARETREWPGVMFANAYVENRLYGGPEEGGQWYDTGEPVASIPFPEADEEVKARWEDYLDKNVKWTSQYESGSILGRDWYAPKIEDHFAESYPQERSRYE